MRPLETMAWELSEEKKEDKERWQGKRQWGKDKGERKKGRCTHLRESGICLGLVLQVLKKGIARRKGILPVKNSRGRLEGLFWGNRG